MPHSFGRFSRDIWWNVLAAYNAGATELAQAGRIQPSVINVDGHPAYPAAIEDLKRSGELTRRCRCRRSRYVNNGIEQDHRFREEARRSQPVVPICGRGGEHDRTIRRYEHQSARGQIRWLPKTDIVGQMRFIDRTLGVTAWP